MYMYVNTINTEVKVSSCGRLFGMVEKARCVQVYNRRHYDRPMLSRRNSSPTVIPTVQNHNFVFQHDNATTIVTQCPAQNQILTLPRSLDICPIDHAWNVLGRSLRDAYPLPPASFADLRVILITGTRWNLIDQGELNTLCDSMVQRLRACIAANGRHTRF